MGKSETGSSEEPEWRFWVHSGIWKRRDGLCESMTAGKPWIDHAALATKYWTALEMSVRTRDEFENNANSVFRAYTDDDFASPIGWDMLRVAAPCIQGPGDFLSSFLKALDKFLATECDPGKRLDRLYELHAFGMGDFRVAIAQRLLFH